jgi:hypothetical protein
MSLDTLSSMTIMNGLQTAHRDDELLYQCNATQNARLVPRVFPPKCDTVKSMILHRRNADSIFAKALICPFCTFLTPSLSSLA